MIQIKESDYFKPVPVSCLASSTRNSFKFCLFPTPGTQLYKRKALTIATSNIKQKMYLWYLIDFVRTE